jgi:hypothetical protein
VDVEAEFQSAALLGQLANSAKRRTEKKPVAKLPKAARHPLPTRSDGLLAQAHVAQV